MTRTVLDLQDYRYCAAEACVDDHTCARLDKNGGNRAGPKTENNLDRILYAKLRPFGVSDVSLQQLVRPIQILR